DDTNQGLDVSGIDYYQYQITENSVTSGWIIVDYSECSSCYNDANTLRTTIGGFQIQNDYSIKVRAIDIAGNQSDISTITYVGDKTPPVIASFEARCSGELIDINDYSSSISTINSSFTFTFSTPSGTQTRAMRYLKDRVVEITLDATDEVSGLGLPGEISSVYYTTNMDSDLHYFSLGEPLLIDTNIIDIPDNSIFKMYLQFYAVDIAGNVSEPYECGIVVNTYAPAPPKIISPSHRYADIPEDSVPFHNVEFDLKMNVQEDVPVNDLNGFRWELLRGYSVETATSVDSGLIHDEQLFIQDLSDNEVNEYYYLKVWAIGDNGRESLEPAVHVFRVDSTPSEGLKLYSPTHSDEDIYYNNSMAVVTWDRPLAFSGVAHYYFSFSDENILPDNMPENYELSDDWQVNSYLYISLNLEAVHEDASGDVYLAVCAEDFSGNRLYDEIKLTFDTIRPTVEFEATASVDDFNPYINLNSPADNFIDNIDHYAVKLFKKYPDKVADTLYDWMNLSREITRIKFYSIDYNMEYIIALVRVYDKSGNYTQYHRSYKWYFKDFPDSNDLLPFELNHKGLKIIGEYYPGQNSGHAFIRVPDYINFNVSGNPQNLIELTDTVFQDDKFLYGSNTSIDYGCIINGYTFNGVGIDVGENNHHHLNNVTYSLQSDANSALDFTYHHNALFLAGDPVFAWSASQSNSPFAIHTIFPVQEDGSTPELAWRFTNTFLSGFMKKNWAIRNCRLDLSDNFNEVNAYVFFNENPYYELMVSEMSISPKLNPIEGQITSDFYLETLGNKFYVTEALIREDKIIILKSQLLLNELITDEKITVENFSIDIKGQCAELIDFRSSPFTIGSNVTVDALGIEEGQLIVRSGELITEDGSVSIADSVLTESGIQGVTGDLVSNYSLQLHGFNITEGKGVNDNGFITLRECKLNLPSNYNSSQVALENLSFNEGDHSIITVGTSTESVVIHDN
ncbi:MAG: hypothetical protein JXR70_17350, partial [Spirochaetales bacterium]|nr:hypothetical protein [Spirochaetales bacterium]